MTDRRRSCRAWRWRPTCRSSCIPAGTRNRFALDLGIDRDDVVAALDAFGAAVERRIDLAEVNGRIFVNNVSLGVYAKVVQSPEYRDAKRSTTLAMLGDLVGPGAEPFDLHFVGPDGAQQDGARIIQISNNPYRLTSLKGFGSRARLDTGELGVAAADIRGARDIAAFFASQWLGRLDRFRGWIRWNTDTLTIESGAPVEAGVDGEALLLDPPLTFRSLPGALRVRVATSAPGYSPAALRAPSPWWTVAALVRAAAGARPPSTRRSARGDLRRRYHPSDPPTREAPPVTYCLALRLDEGLVFLSDTRTNAGVDDVGTYRKLHVLRPGEDRRVRAAVGRLAGHHPGGARPHRRRPRRARRPREPGDGVAPPRGGGLPRAAQPRGQRAARAGARPVGDGHVHPRRTDRR